MSSNPFGGSPKDPFNTQNSSAFKTHERSAYDLAHANADTDADRSAIHHTLGTGPNQAAAGNHKHSLIINNTDFRINGFTGSLQLTKDNRTVCLDFSLNTPAGGAAIDTSVALMVTGWKRLNVYLSFAAFNGWDSVTGGSIPLYMNDDGNLRLGIARAAGTTTHGSITYTSDS